MSLGLSEMFVYREELGRETWGEAHGEMGISDSLGVTWSPLHRAQVLHWANLMWWRTVSPYGNFLCCHQPFQAGSAGWVTEGMCSSIPRSGWVWGAALELQHQHCLILPAANSASSQIRWLIDALEGAFHCVCSEISLLHHGEPLHSLPFTPLETSAQTQWKYWFLFPAFPFLHISLSLVLDIITL